ncbi:hypothetical protein JZ751_003842 [Albula glossodonta]|uniref:Elongation of very long chain fatty acids protein n=1 Tax=Albula glossodonta TaxID=121402 RepID=A0A8T2P806_9TELE|nr:hypothetical protein JZ751_003842 [Albula glossodonta]
MIYGQYKPHPFSSVQSRSAPTPPRSANDVRGFVGFVAERHSKLKSRTDTLDSAPSDQLEAFDKQLNSFVDYLFGERDSRVRGWLLLDSYLPTLSFTIVYLLIVYLGPIYMKNRPAYSLKKVLIVYNFAVTMLSFYMLIELISAAWVGGYRLQCQSLHGAGDADIRVAKVLWWYYFSKLIEFLDTIFFVLRKKNNQISFLHVYHHASMFNIWWCVLNWIPCGQSFFGPTLNSFIHVLMYSYYGLSTIPSMHKYLWWKRYLTQAQLTYRKRQSGEEAKLPIDVKDVKNSHANGFSSSINGSNSKQKSQ